MNADVDLPISGKPTGTPIDQTSGLVQGGSSESGLSYTGYYSATENVTACSVSGNNSNTSQVSITAYPNPFSTEVNFNITSPVSGNGVLELYDLPGRKLTTIYEGNFVGGVQKTITYRPRLLPTQTLFYVFRIGTKTIAGKLLASGF